MRNRGLAYQRIVGKAPNPPDPLLSLVNMSGEQCEHSVHSIQFDRIASVGVLLHCCNRLILECMGSETKVIVYAQKNFLIAMSYLF